MFQARFPALIPGSPIKVELSSTRAGRVRFESICRSRVRPLNASLAHPLRLSHCGFPTATSFDSSSSLCDSGIFASRTQPNMMVTESRSADQIRPNSQLIRRFATFRTPTRQFRAGVQAPSLTKTQLKCVESQFQSA